MPFEMKEFETRNLARLAERAQIEARQVNLVQPLDPKNVDRENRVIRNMRASAPVRDRHDTGWMANCFDRSMPTYMSNPVVDVSHNTSKPPVANVVAWRSDPGGLLVDMQFVPQKRGLKFFELYSDGYMRGLSTMALPTDTAWWNEQSRYSEVGEAFARALEARQMTCVFMQADLLSIALATVPSNPRALTEAAERGLITRAWLLGQGFSPEFVEANLDNKITIRTTQQGVTVLPVGEPLATQPPEDTDPEGDTNADSGDEDTEDIDESDGEPPPAGVAKEPEKKTVRSLASAPFDFAKFVELMK